MMEDFRTPNVKETASILKWVAWIGGVLILVSFILGFFGFFSSWISVPGQIYSVQNVKEQWQFAYDYDEALQAIARQVCNAEAMVASSSTEEEKTQRRDQLFAFQQNYQTQEGNYNAKLRNAFEAKLVRPSDVPEKAPTLEEMKQKVCQ